MKVVYRDLFDKDLSILDKKTIEKVFEKIHFLKLCVNLSELPNLKKLKGYKNVYRIRVWDYRLWFTTKDDAIILERFLHRKDIYKYFPK